MSAPSRMTKPVLRRVHVELVAAARKALRLMAKGEADEAYACLWDALDEEFGKPVQGVPMYLATAVADKWLEQKSSFSAAAIACWKSK